MIMKMDNEQQKEWAEAQKIVVNVNLVGAAKNHLKFLATVDQNRYLYEDRVLKLAIYRYNAFWLPLLATHTESPVSEGPLVVPLDCEWVWHCHRLNPVRYKSDCQKLYGRILTNRNVISTVQATSKGETEEIWKKMYPEEPYELDLSRSLDEDSLRIDPQSEKFTDYDLLAAVKRQISFTGQVTRPHMSNDLYLREAEARYKGFLHLIRANRKLGVKRFCVPTYDVDLMWHTHMLHPFHYCNDMFNLIGMVLQHDDTDSDRSQGGKLNTGFSGTTRQWEETFGRSYWKAGAMYQGNNPTQITQASVMNSDKLKQLSPVNVLEVLLEFGDIKNLPEVYKDDLIVLFGKKHSDRIFGNKRYLNILPVSGEKQVACFECESTGEFLFELKSRSSKVLGSCSLSMEDMLASRSQLSVDKWLLVEPVPSLKISEPLLLRVFLSFTPPTPVYFGKGVVKSDKGSEIGAKSAKCGDCIGQVCGSPCIDGSGKVENDSEIMAKSAKCGDCIGQVCGSPCIDESGKVGNDSEIVAKSAKCGDCIGQVCGSPCIDGSGKVGNDSEIVAKSAKCGDCIGQVCGSPCIDGSGKVENGCEIVAKSAKCGDCIGQVCGSPCIDGSGTVENGCEIVAKSAKCGDCIGEVCGSPCIDGSGKVESGNVFGGLCGGVICGGLCSPIDDDGNVVMATA